MDWIALLSGIAVFIHGLQLANDGLQKRAGDQMRRWLTAQRAHANQSMLLSTDRRGFMVRRL